MTVRRDPRIQQALEALKEILAYIPADNFVSIYTFSDEVIPIVTMSPPTYAYSQLSNVQRVTRDAIVHGFKPS